MSTPPSPDADLLRAAFELAPIGVVITDESGRILWPNAAFCQMLGHPREALVDRPGHRLTHPEDRLVEQVQHADLVAGRVQSYRLRKRFVDAGGATVHTLQTVHRTHAGGQTRLVAHVVDLTEQVEREVEAQTHERMRTVGRLASSIAHDFNNLLTAIQTNGAMIAESVDDPAVLEMVEDVLAASETGARLTDRLLGFTRGGAARSERIDLGALVRDRHPALRSIAPGSRVEVDAPAGAWVTGDPAQLEQILLNLVANGRGAHRIEVLVKVLWNDVHLVVADDGPGMPESVRARAFEPYFTTRRGEGGTGLGLTMVYAAVANHSGRIAIESKLGQGTRVTVQLPLVEGPTGDAWEAPDDGGPVDPHVTQAILVVDDDGPVRRAVVRALRGAGLEVFEADGVASARARLARHQQRLAVLIADIVLRDGNGVELAAEARAERPSLQVLYMSGYDASDLQPYATGALEPLLTKPFTAEDVLAHVLPLVSGSRRSPG